MNRLEPATHTRTFAHCDAGVKLACAAGGAVRLRRCSLFQAIANSGDCQRLAPILQANPAKGVVRPYLERIMSRLTASRVAFDLVASFEGYRARAARAPDGQWTLGFGHTATAREGLSVTRSEAEDLLRWDLLPIEDTVRQAALMPLSQNQFDALVSFAFNIGLENFKTSDVLRALNQGQPVAAALAMHAWRRAQVNGQVLTIDALVRRRAAESALFLETSGARPAAPTSVIRPQIDYSAALLSHGVETTSIVTPLVGEITPAPFLRDAWVKDVVAPSVDEETETAAPAVEQVVEEQTATSPETVTTMAERVPMQVLSSEEIVEAVQPAPDLVTEPQSKPTPPTPPLAPPVQLPQSPAPQAEFVAAEPKAVAEASPIIPAGLSPFPGTTTYVPANGTQTQTALPANDGSTTRLYSAPETVETPRDLPQVEAAQPKQVGPKIMPLKAAEGTVPPLIWILIGLGAGLLALGLYSSWQSGMLSVQTNRVEPTGGQLAALLAAAIGFMVLVTSSVAALTGAMEDAPPP
jgi:lysozyme